MAKRMSEDDGGAGKPNLSPDTFLEHYREIRKARVEVEQATATFRNARKRAKSAGVNMAALSLMETFARMDPDEAALQLKQFGYYAQTAGLSFATQGELFGHYDDPKPSEKAAHVQALFDAEDAGRRCGAGGNSETLNPHQAGTELHARFHAGWINGRKFYDQSTGGAAPKEKRQGAKRRGGNPEDRPAV